MARAEGQPLHGELRMGVIPTIAPFLLPAMLPRLRQQWPNLKLLPARGNQPGGLRGASSRPARLRAARAALRLRRGRQRAAVRRSACSSPSRAAKRRRAARSTAATIDENRLLLLEDGHCLKDHALSACNRPELRAACRDDGHLAAHAGADGRQRPWPDLHAGHGDRRRDPRRAPASTRGRWAPIIGYRRIALDLAPLEPPRERVPAARARSTIMREDRLPPRVEPALAALRRCGRRGRTTAIAGSAIRSASLMPCGRSKRSAFMTLVQALTKSRTNFSSWPFSA